MKDTEILVLMVALLVTAQQSSSENIQVRFTLTPTN
jgi:hypothetical protein